MFLRTMTPSIAVVVCVATSVHSTTPELADSAAAVGSAVAIIVFGAWPADVGAALECHCGGRGGDTEEREELGDVHGVDIGSELKRRDG